MSAAALGVPVRMRPSAHSRSFSAASTIGASPDPVFPLRVVAARGQAVIPDLADGALMPRAPVFPLCLLVVTPDVVCTALPGRIPVCRDQVGVLLAAPIRPVAQPLVRRVGIGVEGDVP